jgi:hypothetical protein
MLELEGTCLQHKKQLIEVNIELKNHKLWVQIQKLNGKLETFHKSLDKASQPTYMDKQLREFEELLLDNGLLKV